jgi:hypothetical protein
MSELQNPNPTVYEIKEVKRVRPTSAPGEPEPIDEYEVFGAVLALALCNDSELTSYQTSFAPSTILSTRLRLSN